MDRYDTPIDPRLLAAGEELGGIVAGSDGVVMTEAMEEAMTDQIQNPATINQDMIVASGIEFVRGFSRINVIRSQTIAMNKKNERHLEVYRGNSRDEPTAYEFQCTNAGFGCTYKHAASCQVREHELICKITSREALEQLELVGKTKPFPCTTGV